MQLNTWLYHIKIIAFLKKKIVCLGAELGCDIRFNLAKNQEKDNEEVGVDEDEEDNQEEEEEYVKKNNEEGHAEIYAAIRQLLRGTR